MNTTESEQKLTRKEAENIALCMWDMLKMQSSMGGKVDVDWYKGRLDELLNEHFANASETLVMLPIYDKKGREILAEIKGLENRLRCYHEGKYGRSTVKMHVELKYIERIKGLIEQRQEQRPH